jgi:hypothetical protein
MKQGSIVVECTWIALAPKRKTIVVYFDIIRVEIVHNVRVVYRALLTAFMTEKASV